MKNHRALLRAEQTRRRVAEEAARIMVEQAISDYRQAKQKAASRLGIEDRKVLPKNTEIEEAIHAYQRLFAGETHGDSLRKLRLNACEAMRLFASFEPRLVGPVLNGTASLHSDVELHLFSETAEAVAFHLMKLGIPFRSGEARHRYNHQDTQAYPVFRFEAGDAAVRATVFPRDGLRQAPRSPVDGKPIRRADLKQLESLLDAV